MSSATSSSRRHAVSHAALGALALALVFPLTLEAQRDTRSDTQRDAPSGRGSFGIHAQVSEPKGDFANNTSNGWGLGAYFLGGLDQNSIFNIRGDFSFVNYANSRRRIPLSGTGGLIQLDLRTSSNIFSVVAGPQLLGPTGTFTPYATALGGFSVFSTESTIEGSDNTNTPFASTTNSNDVVWAYGGAVGAYVRVYNGRNPVRLDIGARFLRHDDASYLNDQRVKEAFENNRPAIPLRGRADFITYYLGVNIIAF
ncbi:hypothetical protein [Gemmatimonas aurantiaca]|uniref:hypothetical protein n=1 Tax=Gemmatimonas aurantiaca TaxID=173480 RepID=UPI00301CACE5